MAIASSGSDSVPQAALTRCLRELPNCLVLRSGEELFRNLQRGGDVDLLVEDLGFAERTLIHHLGPPVRVTRRSYVTGYFYDWGNIDLLPSIEWRGARYLPVRAVIDGGRITETGWRVPSLAHEAVISWLSSLLFGGFFKERFTPVIRQAVQVDGVALRTALMEVAGTRWGTRLWQAAADGHPESSARWAQSLRRAIWWRAFLKSPLRTLNGYLAFAVAELKLRLVPSVPWIAVIGSDESATSTLVDEIARRFTTCRYAAVHDPPRRYWTQLADLRAKGFIPVFDNAASPGRARTLQLLAPKPDLVFLLDSASEVLWQRKHAQLPAGKVLNGSLPASVLVDEVQRVIRAWILDRSVTTQSRTQGLRMAAHGGTTDGGVPILVSRDHGKVTGTL